MECRKQYILENVHFVIKILLTILTKVFNTLRQSYIIFLSKLHFFAKLLMVLQMKDKIIHSQINDYC